MHECQTIFTQPKYTYYTSSHSERDRESESFFVDRSKKKPIHTNILHMKSQKYTKQIQNISFLSGEFIIFIKFSSHVLVVVGLLGAAASVTVHFLAHKY